MCSIATPMVEQQLCRIMVDEISADRSSAISSEKLK